MLELVVDALEPEGVGVLGGDDRRLGLDDLLVRRAGSGHAWRAWNLRERFSPRLSKYARSSRPSSVAGSSANHHSRPIRYQLRVARSCPRTASTPVSMRRPISSFAGMFSR